jgi:hypothetical protein
MIKTQRKHQQKQASDPDAADGILHKFPFPLLTFSSQFIQIYDFQSSPNWFELFHLASRSSEHVIKKRKRHRTAGCMCVCAAPSDEQASRAK